MNYHKANQRFLDISIQRLKFIGLLTIIFGIGIILRLFFLQVVEHSKFVAIAKRQHESGITIPARRGEILTKDPHSNNYFKLATNITLDLLYVDPTEVIDRFYTAKLLAPYVFSQTDYELCLEDDSFCPTNDSESSAELSIETTETNDNDSEIIKPRSTYLEQVEKNIATKIAKSEVTYVLIKDNLNLETINQIQNLSIPGITVNPDQKTISANPLLIPAADTTRIARILSPLLNMNYKVIEQKFEHKFIRYVPLKRKISPEISAEIKKLISKSYTEAQNDQSKNHLLKGVVLLPEHWRFYPNNNLAAQIIGFYNNEFGGQYGLEESFDNELIGKQGTILADIDPTGNAISFGEQDIINVINGKSLVLTIVPTIQRKIEEILEKKIKEYNAVSAQVVILNPFTGAIIAMVNAPTFDPNKYWEASEKKPINKWEKIPDYIDVFVKENDQFRTATEEERNNYELERFIYANQIGPAVYRNKIIQDIYEPGSVFKPITMAVALDRNEINPQSKYLDSGVIKTGEFLGEKEIEIHNANNKIYGWVTMTQCLENSINTCLAYVAKKLGKKFYAPLFYKYIKDFGFGEYTDIELINEEKGEIEFWDQWTETKLVTTAFGQGISSTPLQVVTAWAALANGGILIKPHLIDSIIDTNGTMTKTEPSIIRRVISKETSSTITAMLVSTVNNGQARSAQVPKYLLAGKTGTSQIAKTKGLGYESGEGSNITSFIGYAPVHHPKFVMLVKFDRPRYGSNTTWGTTTAAPTFKEISEFLFDYYNVPPDNE